MKGATTFLYQQYGAEERIRPGTDWGHWFVFPSVL